MKFYYYATILVGIMMILAIGGFDLPISGGIVKTLGLITDGEATPEKIKQSKLWDDESVNETTGEEEETSGGISLAWILGGLAVVGIVAGLFGRTPDPRFITGGFVMAVAGAIIADYIAIFNHLTSYGVPWVTYGAGFLFTVIITGLFISIKEWWEGVD